MNNFEYVLAIPIIISQVLGIMAGFAIDGLRRRIKVLEGRKS